MDEKKWIKAVFDSIKGIKRANPPTDLFAAIADQVTALKTNVISIYQRRIAAAVAALLIILNGYAMRYYGQNGETEIVEAAVEIYPAESLTFNYQFYEL